MNERALLYKAWQWQIKLVRVFDLLKKCAEGFRVELETWRAVVTNKAQEFLLQHRSLSGALLGCLPKCAWDLLLMFSAPVPRTIHIQISLKTALIYLKHCILHLEINAKWYLILIRCSEINLVITDHHVTCTHYVICAPNYYFHFAKYTSVCTLFLF